MEKSFGTKRALMLYNNIILLIASVLLFVSFYFNTLLFLIFGRLLVGVYTGISCALVPIYVQEMAPKHIKGALSCFVHIGVCAGSALGAFLSIENVLGGPFTWHLLLALPAIFGLTQIVLNYYTPDTPNYYLNKGNKSEAANSIKFYYALENYDDDAVIREYKQLVTKIPRQVSFYEAFSDSKTRKGIILGIIVSATQVFSGSMAVVSYST
uniref:Major facilitator superfamily (MFS) profile domain-containing protein n=1 Tax=Panagrolaimus sp. ES5 TaxID=591445 RepID=A0AC34FLX8_9BILA